MRTRLPATGLAILAFCGPWALNFARQDGGDAKPAEPAPPSTQAVVPDPNAPDGQSVEPEKILPPSAYAEGERPPAKSRIYDAKPAKVWPAIVSALRAADVPIESSDEATGRIMTRLTRFEHVRFYDVATPPPKFTRARPVFQLIHLNQGWFSVEIQAEKVKGGTNVSVRAYIEENAHDILHAHAVRAERHSNGKIEDYFFARFDDALK